MRGEIKLVDATLSFRVSPGGHVHIRRFAKPALEALGFDFSTVENSVIVPDADDPDGVYVLSFDLKPPDAPDQA